MINRRGILGLFAGALASGFVKPEKSTGGIKTIAESIPDTTISEPTLEVEGFPIDTVKVKWNNGFIEGLFATTIEDNRVVVWCSAKAKRPKLHLHQKGNILIIDEERHLWWEASAELTQAVMGADINKPLEFRLEWEIKDLRMGRYENKT